MISRSGYAAVLAGALVTVIVWGLQQWAHVDMPALIQGAVTTLATAAFGEWWPDTKTTPQPPTT